MNYLLSSNLGEFLILFTAMVIGFRDVSGAIAMPLLATQILWLNLVTDGLSAVAIYFIQQCPGGPVKYTNSGIPKKIVQVSDRLRHAGRSMLGNVE